MRSTLAFDFFSSDILGSNLLFDTCWKALHCLNTGDLFMKKGQWMKIQDFIIKLQYTHHSQTYSQSENSRSCHTFLYLQINAQLMLLPIDKKSACKSPLPAQQQSMVTWKCHWKMGKPSWKVIYIYSSRCKDGDVA
jgi:hypothetical protein